MGYISVTKFLKQCPEYGGMHRNDEWITECVGNTYDYDGTVCYYQLYAYHGVFMELFIRKCLCTRFGLPCEDDRTENLLENNRLYSRYFEQELMNAYEAYTDPQTRAIDIIKDIKVVALSHRLTHHNGMEDLRDAHNMIVNLYNLREVVSFLNQLPYGYIMYKKPFVFRYGNLIMRGVPDFIFDGHVFCQVATSRHRGSYKKKYAQVLLYILCHYGANYYADAVEQEYTIMIYNPLLGATHTVELLMTPWDYEDLYGSVVRDLNAIFHKYSPKNKYYINQ